MRARLESAGGVVLSMRRGFSLPRLAARVTDEDLALWAGELAVLLRAGVPMVEALSMAGDPHGALATVTPALLQRIQEGRSLSQAISAEPGAFPAALAAGLSAGERSGELPSVLQRLSEHLERRSILADRVRSALLYPAVLAMLATAVLGFLIGYVVPSFAAVLADTHAQLPTVTRWVLAASGFAGSHALTIVVCIAGAAAGIATLCRRPDTGTALDRVLARLPWLGEVLTRTAVAAWSQTLGMLVAGAVPLVEALPLAAGAVGNRWLASRLRAITSDVEQGEGLARAVARAAVLPERVVRMVAVGAETAELPHMLEQVARLEGQAAQSRLEAASRLLEPALMIVMGIAVAIVLVAMFLPIVELAATL
ncbi:MAG: type II secretion system F family protein [Candidatus Wallbacteria bacterium]|nr:type II secretion system F family protein [Candidatus Wallbacteria bacterium]